MSYQLFTVYDRIHHKTYHIAVQEGEGIPARKHIRAYLPEKRSLGSSL